MLARGTGRTMYVRGMCVSVRGAIGLHQRYVTSMLAAPRARTHHMIVLSFFGLHCETSDADHMAVSRLFQLFVFFLFFFWGGGSLCCLGCF